MSWWSDLIARLTSQPETSPPQPLPGEPNVFECQACGKVFDSTAERARCPECESTQVERVS